MSDIVEVLNEIVERHDCSHSAIVSKASAEITRLTAEVEQNTIDLEEYRRDVEKLRAALEFYANPQNWVSVWDHQFKMMAQEPVYRDEGNKARTALSGDKQ